MSAGQITKESGILASESNICAVETQGQRVTFTDTASDESTKKLKFGQHRLRGKAHE